VAALAEIRRRLVLQGSGRILMISSVGAIRVRRSAYLYGGAKAGLDRLCEGLADSLDGTGVTLQILRAGVVRTRMSEGREDVPFTTGVNEVAQTVMKGLASGDRIIWSPPILRYVFGLLRHLPAPLWRKVVDR
jgi:decaprenylphospho-beta-D-erythro-pentofuranosid-2-ulose 2-reductase